MKRNDMLVKKLSAKDSDKQDKLVTSYIIERISVTVDVLTCSMDNKFFFVRDTLIAYNSFEKTR
jgi:hypothetical protein